MADTTIQDFTKFRYLPLYRARLRFSGSTSDVHNIADLDSNSDFSLTPIIKTDDKGMSIPVAYEFNSTLISSYNTFKDYNTMLGLIGTKDVVEFSIYWQAMYGQTHGALMTCTFNTPDFSIASSCACSAIRATFSQQQNETLPELKIEVRGIMTAAAWHACLYPSANFITSFWV